MPLPTFLVNGTVKEAADYLARRQVAVRAGEVSPLTKIAAGIGDFLSSTWDRVSNSPTLANAMGLAKQYPEAAGAALGGGLGGLAGAGSYYLGDEENRRNRGVLSSLLTGGLAGAAAGAGGGAMYRVGRQALAPEVQTTMSPQEAQEIQRKLMAGEKIPAEENARYMRTMKPFERPATFGSVVGQGWDMSPRGSSLVPPALAAMHTPRLGEKLWFGRIRPRFSTDPEHLAKGINEVLHAIPGNSTATGDPYYGSYAAMRDLVKDPSDLKSQARNLSVTGDPYYAKNVTHGDATISREQIRRLAEAGVLGKTTALNKVDPKVGVPDLYRIGGKTFQRPWLMRGAGSLLGAAALPYMYGLGLNFYDYLQNATNASKVTGEKPWWMYGLAPAYR